MAVSYIVLGIYPDGSEPARLSYPTLDQAMQKIRDLVEADEIDDDGAMFCEYGIVVDPPPKTKHARDLEDAIARGRVPANGSIPIPGMTPAPGKIPGGIQMPAFAPPPTPEAAPAPFKFPRG